MQLVPDPPGGTKPHGGLNNLGGEDPEYPT